MASGYCCAPPVVTRSVDCICGLILHGHLIKFAFDTDMCKHNITCTTVQVSQLSNTDHSQHMLIMLAHHHENLDVTTRQTGAHETVSLPPLAY